MKGWEKRIKDKLEGYEVNPPEGSLADFRQRLDASRAPSRKAKRHVFPYIAAAGVAAACLALVLTMMQPEDIAPSREQSSVTKVADKSIVQPYNRPTAQPSNRTTAQPYNRKTSQPYNRITSQPSNRTTAQPYNRITAKPSNPPTAQDKEEQYSLIADLPSASEDTLTLAQDDESSVGHLGIGRGEEYSVPRFALNKKTWLASGGILATTLGGAVLSSLGSSDYMDNTFHDLESNLHNGSEWHPVERKDVPLGDAEHSAPLKLGLSARWRFANRWALTSGLEYSRYKSNIKYSLSGIKTQLIDCIALPVRCDYSIAKTRWAEVYLGAGGAVDYCAKATLDGKRIERDGFSFSLLGAVGAQLNITKRIGVYLEPQVSWLMPASENKLETYRTEHPISFNISTGVRYTISR